MSHLALILMSVWTAGPVSPGEHAYLAGSDFGSDPRVVIDGTVLKPDVADERSLVFAYPCDRAKAVSGKIVSAGRVTGTFTLNHPDVWWLSGDQFDYSSPEGRLRVFGRMLDGGRVTLVEKSGKSYVPRMLRQAREELIADCEDIPEGEYDVAVENSFGGRTAAGKWKIAPARKYWKDDVFEITAFGAKANDGLDDTKAIQSALAAAEKNGGGIVRVPRGRFQVSDSLKLPVGTILSGESKDLSVFYWLDTMTPPPTLMYVSSETGVRNLSFRSGQYRHGIESYNCAHDIFFENVSLRFVSDQRRDRGDRYGETNFLARYCYPGDVLKFHPATKRIRLENCDVYRDKHGCASCFLLAYGQDLHVKNCRFTGTGFALLDEKRMIVEDSYGLGCTCGLFGDAHDIYFARNSFELKFSGDREGFTSDGDSDFGRRIKELPDIDGNWWSNKVHRTHFAFVDNTMRDCRVAFQLYGGGRDAVVARNRIQRAGGLQAYGFDGRWPAHRIEICDNIVEVGNSLEGIFGLPGADGTSLGCTHVYGPPTRVQNRHFVLKRNRIESNGLIAFSSVRGGLAEGNVIRDSEVGISGGRFNESLYIGRNDFENVVMPYVDLKGARIEAFGKDCVPAPPHAPSPEVWIVQGDAVDYSTYGGEIRLYGRGLRDVELMYFSKDFGSLVLPKKSGDDYQASFAVLPRIRACTGVIRLRKGGEEKWTTCCAWCVSNPGRLGERVFDVVAFGAIPNDRKDDTVAFSNALAAAAAAGGGTVRVPCGRFLLRGTLAVPAKTRLAGVAKEKSCIYWMDTMEPPADFITLGDGSGISDLLISTGQYRGGIAAYDASGRPGHVSDITLENLTLRFLSDIQREPGRSNGKFFLQRYRMPGAAVSVPDSTRVKIHKVDLYSDKDPVASSHLDVSGADIAVTESRILGTGLVRIEGTNIVFDRNEGYATSFQLGAACTNLYFGRSYLHRRLAGEREVLMLPANNVAKRILFVGNTIEDSGLVQFGGGVSQVVVAENACTRSGGLIASGACTDVAFLDNRIVDGNCLRGPFDRELPEDAVIGAIAEKGAALSRGVILRGNRIDGNGYLDVRGAAEAVVEENSIANADCGIVGAETAPGVTLGHNDFLNVTRPSVGLASAKRDEAPRKKRVLIVNQALGYPHQMALAVGTEKIIASGRERGDFEAEAATVEALKDPAFVARFDAIVLNNTTALECKDVPGLAETLVGFVKGGKGIAFIHAAVDAFYGSKEMQALSGGLFSGHPWYYDGTWTFRNECPDDPLNASFKGAKTFRASDEIYQQKSPPFDRKNCKVLVSLVADDPANRRAEENWRHHSLERIRRDFPIRADRDFAVSWTKEEGLGRVFYTSFGHDERAFEDPARLGHILAGIRFVIK